MENREKKFEYMDLSNDEINLIEGGLDRYTLSQYPSQDEINQCIDNLYKYVPQTKSKKKEMNKFIDKIEFQLSYINKLYIIISLMIFIITCGLAINNIINPYGALMFISPIPFVLGVTEVFKGKENNMLELELSYKISGKELILYRMIIIAVFNIILNVIMTVMLCNDIISMQFIKINILWIVPFVWVNFICIILAEKIRSSYAVTIVISLWIVIVAGIYSNNKLVQWLLSLNTCIYGLMIVVGVSAVFIKIKKYKKCEMYSFAYKN